MNGGVKLAIEGAASVPSLASLADAGVEILACGTCLDLLQGQGQARRRQGL